MDLRLVNLETLDRAIQDVISNEDYEQVIALNQIKDDRLTNPTPLKYFVTEFKAIDISDGELKKICW